MRLFTSTLCFALGSTLFAAAPPSQAKGDAANKKTVKTIKDVYYYTGDDQDKIKHRLDLYLPTKVKDFPVVLFVHGGAWLHGDKTFMGFYPILGRTLAKHGIGCVVTNYRLSPKIKHPEHVKDVARAFAWVYKNIGRYGGKADQVFLCGHSAGGHLVSLLATDETYLKAVGLTTKAIRGVLPISGVYILPDGFLRIVFGNKPNVYKDASPIEHVKKGLPPFLIFYADKDLRGCDKSPSEKFCKTLKDKGNDASTVEVKDSNHYKIIMSAAFPDHTVSKAIIGFVQKQIAKE
jgi:acetyl esterase/lipase